MNELDKEREEYIEEVARVVIKILKDCRAVRTAGNLEPNGVFTEDLLIKLQDLGFSISQATYYNDVRPMCIELGYDVTSNGNGQYIGLPGEWTRNVKNSKDQIVGRTHNQRKILTAASEAMSLETGNDYCKRTFAMNLVEMANFFKLVGEATKDPTLPWPQELHKWLLENENVIQQ